MAAAAPYIIAAAGTAVKMRADQQQAQEQRQQLNAALSRTDETQKKANAAIGEEAAKLAPTARMANLNNQAGADVTQAKSDLTASGATDSGGNSIIDTAGDGGAVSKEFLTDKADRAISEGTRLSSIAQQLARTRAPGQLVEQEGQGRANLTEQLANMWGTTQNLNSGNATTAQGIQEPGYGQVGQLAASLGSAYAAKGAGTGSKAALVPKNAKGGYIWSGGDGSGMGSIG
jgi:hypothetical protein